MTLRIERNHSVPRSPFGQCVKHRPCRSFGNVRLQYPRFIIALHEHQSVLDKDGWQVTHKDKPVILWHSFNSRHTPTFPLGEMRSRELSFGKPICFARGAA